MANVLRSGRPGTIKYGNKHHNRPNGRCDGCVIIANLIGACSRHCFSLKQCRCFEKNKNQYIKSEEYGYGHKTGEGRNWWGNKVFLTP